MVMISSNLCIVIREEVSVLIVSRRLYSFPSEQLLLHLRGVTGRER